MIVGSLSHNIIIRGIMEYAPPNKAGLGHACISTQPVMVCARSGEQMRVSPASRKLHNPVHSEAILASEASNASRPACVHFPAVATNLVATRQEKAKMISIRAANKSGDREVLVAVAAPPQLTRRGCDF